MLGARAVWAVGGDEVDRATERRRAEGQRVAALVDLDRTQGERVDLIEVAAPIREVERDPILQHLDAAQVEASGDAGTAHRQAQLLSVTLLDVDPGTSLSTSRSVFA